MQNSEFNVKITDIFRILNLKGLTLCFVFINKPESYE